MSFLESLDLNINGNQKIMYFLPSNLVSAFPCARRRALLLQNQNGANGENTSSSKVYIPFEPENRINTEATNRKHAGINGFTQFYLNTNSDSKFDFVINGYLFTVNVNTDDFYRDYLSTLNSNIAYVNILLSEETLFGFDTDGADGSAESKSYTTLMLSSQNILNSDTDLTSLDKLSTTAREEISANGDSYNSIVKDLTNYYFSGLSFSTEPLAELNNDSDTLRYGITCLEKAVGSTKTINLYAISLKVFIKSDDDWQIYYPSYLPNIEHGDTENSIKVKKIQTKNIELTTEYSETDVVVANVPSLTVNEIVRFNDKTHQNETVYQLQFDGATMSKNE